MSNFDKDKAIDIVNACLDLPEPARTEYIDRECSGNDALREHVHGLVKYREDEDDDEDENLALADPILGKIIDNQYQIRKKVGEGGQGTVYLATDIKINKQVAIKIIKPGTDTKSVLRRFSNEQKTLSLMNHSGIAKIFNAGYFENQRPYFAMEYVPGLPITEFCDKKQLNIKSRIELFIKVCNAVQYAHSMAVIHRDLKPGNVLVHYEGADISIKIIDFGIAKAITREQSGQTDLTSSGLPIGTPEYLSPEQAEMTPQSASTQTDVYALGLMLHKLLTGKLPPYTKELASTSIDKYARIIRDSVTIYPSTFCQSIIDSTLEEAIEIAKSRNININNLTDRLRGDLDCVILKCLEKERSRRYNTVDALKEELTRYLNNLPVLARRPSLIYQFKKFAQRKSELLTAICVVVFTLFLGIGLITKFAYDSHATNLRLEATLHTLQVTRQNETNISNMLEQLLEESYTEISGKTDFLRAEDRIEKTELKGPLYYSLARYCHNAGDLSEAIKYYDKSLTNFDADEIDDLNYTQKAHYNLSSIYLWSIKDYAKAQQHASIALTQSKEIENSFWIRMCKRMKIFTLNEMPNKENHVEALELAKELVDSSKAIGKYDSDLFSNINLYAQTLLQSKNYTEAEKIIDELIELTSIKGEFTLNKLDALYTKMTIKGDQNLMGEELTAGLEGLQIAVEYYGDSSIQLTRFLQQISHLYFMEHDWTKFLIYEKHEASIDFANEGYSKNYVNTYIGILQAQVRLLDSIEMSDPGVYSNLSHANSIASCEEVLRDAARVRLIIENIEEHYNNYIELTMIILDCYQHLGDTKKEIETAYFLHDILDGHGNTHRFAWATSMNTIEYVDRNYEYVINSIESLLPPDGSWDNWHREWYLEKKMARNKLTLYVSSNQIDKALEHANLLLSYDKETTDLARVYKLDSLTQIIIPLWQNHFYAEAGVYASMQYELINTFPLDNETKVQYLPATYPALFYAQKLDQALLCAGELLEIYTSLYGHSHVKTLNALYEIGNTLLNQSKYEEAMEYFQKAFELSYHVKSNETAGLAMQGLSLCHRELGNNDKSIKLFKETIKIMVEVFEPDSKYIAFTKQELGLLLVNEGQYEEAIELLKAALEFDRYHIEKIYSDQLNPSLLNNFLPSLDRNADALITCYEMTNRPSLANELREDQLQFFTQMEGLRSKAPSTSDEEN
jgi:serine/threonine protein kinase